MKLNKYVNGLRIFKKSNGSRSRVSLKEAAIVDFGVVLVHRSQLLHVVMTPPGFGQSSEVATAASLTARRQS